MLEVVAGKAIYDKLKKKEAFEGEEAKAEEKKGGFGGVLIGILLLLIYIGLGLWASRLSWSSNSLIGWGGFPKTIFSFFAFFGNTTYLLSHLIHKLDLLAYIKEHAPAAPVAVAP